ncbi:MAG: enolase C-terminal domain-like protein [Pseudomonadota bacterium]
MRIEAVKLRKLAGTLETEGLFWEDRLLWPVDIYPEYRDRMPWGAAQKDDRHLSVEACFVDILTDEGVIGRAGPFDESIAQFIKKRLAPIIIDQDPIAHEKLWDQMHRIMVHGRQGEPMQAISAVDCALWDLKGRWLGQPIYKLIGGPTREIMPCYASMLGFNVTDMGRVAERASAYQNMGFKAQKWFFRFGPMSGAEGLKQNVALVETLRETLGADDDIMLDCWQAMDHDYVVKLTERIEEFSPRWLEEPAMPDRIETYARIRAATTIPISGAEHEYTRWGFKRFLDADALDIYQPDIYWAGGLSEVLKIAAMVTADDRVIIPHGHSTAINTHFSVSQSPIHTPYQEYLVKWNAIHQLFLKQPMRPVNGSLSLPTAAGASMELDPARIEKEEEL